MLLYYSQTVGLKRQVVIDLLYWITVVLEGSLEF